MQRDLNTHDLHICALVTEGKQNQEIAQAIGVSKDVATARLKRIMEHLDLHNRAQIAAWYVRATEVRR